MTDEVKVSEQLDEIILDIFALADDVTFYDGIETDFSRALIRFMLRHKQTAVSSLTDVLVSDRFKPTLISEALRWIGYLDDPTTHSERLWLLNKSLESQHAVVRDGAALGLSYMDDPAAIPYLETAIEHETVSELQNDMQQVLEQLQSTRAEA